MPPRKFRCDWCDRWAVLRWNAGPQFCEVHHENGGALWSFVVAIVTVCAAASRLAP